MGRMGVGPDQGDEQIGGDSSEWQCSRCNYPNIGNTCRDCGQPRYLLVRRYRPEPVYEMEPAPRVRKKCTCGSCPVHGKKEKPLTKKQKAAEKKFVNELIKDMKYTLSPDKKVRDKHWKKKVKQLQALAGVPPIKVKRTKK